MLSVMSLAPSEPQVDSGFAYYIHYKPYTDVYTFSPLLRMYSCHMKILDERFVPRNQAAAQARSKSSTQTVYILELFITSD